MKRPFTLQLIKNRHHIVLAIFLMFHALTSLFTTYFGDDYYYANFVREGFDYFVNENVFHYLNTNGRALVHLIDELLLGFGFMPWRIASVAVMAALVIVMAKLAAQSYRRDADPERYKNAVITVCGLLCVTDTIVLRQSFYWATGALNYLFPAVLTLWYVYLLRRAYERDKNAYLLAPMVLIACATTEQASAAALLAVLWIGVSALIQKRHRILPAVAVNLVAALVGFASLFLAPGNSVRTTYYPDFYAMSLPERILYNIPRLIDLTFGTDGIATLIVAVLITVIWKSYKKATPLAVFTGAVLGLYIYGIGTTNLDILGRVWFHLLLVIPLAVVAAVTVVDYFKRGEIDNLYFVWCAVAMQCAMALSPEYGQRTLTISLVLLAIPVARAVIEEASPALYLSLAAAAIATLPRDMSNVYVFAVALILGAAISMLIAGRAYNRLAAALAVTVTLSLFATVPAGYLENVSALRLNEEQIEHYEPSSGEPLTLYYLPNGTYKYTMPYDDLYHQHVYLILHDLPSDTPVVYISMP